MLIQVRKTRRRVALLAATACALVIAPGTAVAALTGAGSGTSPAPQAWSVDLTTLTDDDVGVHVAGGSLRLDRMTDRSAEEPVEDSAKGSAGSTDKGSTDKGSTDKERSGQLLAEPVDLDSPAGAVTADVDATTPDGTSVLVDVRARLVGQGPDSWTEWVPEGEQLPAASETVQARVTLVGGREAGPTVRAVHLTPEPRRSTSLQDVEGEADSTAVANAYRVFATREGLVGGTTANGHVITERDHFVALPSRRGLSSNNSGSYSVRVCAATTGRCAYAPVWDVGPWNTTDDYWNPAGTRQSWTDLPQGKPQSQAAYQDGYNGGLDGFDRRVANPAGIDLGDGTFWDGLGLTDNAWTTVTYLWTGSGPTGVVSTSGGPLTVRSGPGTGSAAVGQAGRHANVVIECTASGTSVTGPFGTSSVWDRIGPNNWIADAYVNTGSDSPVAPAC